jgi:hypothetical protein
MYNEIGTLEVRAWKTSHKYLNQIDVRSWPTVIRKLSMTLCASAKAPEFKHKMEVGSKPTRAPGKSIRLLKRNLHVSRWRKDIICKYVEHNWRTRPDLLKCKGTNKSYSKKAAGRTRKTFQNGIARVNQRYAFLHAPKVKIWWYLDNKMVLESA